MFRCSFFFNKTVVPKFLFSTQYILCYCPVGALEVKKQALLSEDSSEKCAISSREDNSHALGLEYILPTELR
jgi:hypothetical protein